jgi:hypothetical protein
MLILLKNSLFWKQDSSPEILLAPAELAALISSGAIPVESSIFSKFSVRFLSF